MYIYIYIYQVNKVYEYPKNKCLMHGYLIKIYLLGKIYTFCLKKNKKFRIKKKKEQNYIYIYISFKYPLRW